MSEITCKHLKRNNQICGKVLKGKAIQERGYCGGCWRTVKSRADREAAAKSGVPTADAEVPVTPDSIPLPPSPLPNAPFEFKEDDLYNSSDEDDSDTDVIQLKQSSATKQLLRELSDSAPPPSPSSKPVGLISEADLVSDQESLQDTIDSPPSDDEYPSEDPILRPQPIKRKTSTVHVINDGVKLMFHAVGALPNMKGFGLKVQDMASGSLKHLVLEMCEEEKVCDTLDTTPASQKLLLLLGGAAITTYLENVRANPQAQLPEVGTNPLPPPPNLPHPPSSDGLFSLLFDPEEERKKRENKQSMIDMNLIK